MNPVTESVGGLVGHVALLLGRWRREDAVVLAAAQTANLGRAPALGATVAVLVGLHIAGLLWVVATSGPVAPHVDRWRCGLLAGHSGLLLLGLTVWAAARRAKRHRDTQGRWIPGAFAACGLPLASGIAAVDQLVTPNITPVAASTFAVAHKLRRAVESHRIDYGADSIALTLSVGIAHFGPDAPRATFEELYAAADGALYRAKQGGRNCVAIDGDESRRRSAHRDAGALSAGASRSRGPR